MQSIIRLVITLNKRIKCSLKIAHRLMYIKYNKPRNIFFVNRLIKRSSYKGRMVNALASGADEGRDKLR